MRVRPPRKTSAPLRNKIDKVREHVEPLNQKVCRVNLPFDEFNEQSAPKPYPVATALTPTKSDGAAAASPAPPRPPPTVSLTPFAIRQVHSPTLPNFFPANTVKTRRVPILTVPVKR